MLGRKSVRNIIKDRHEQIGIFSASVSRNLVADVRFLRLRIVLERRV